jgi:hypothetical protein
MEKLENQKLEKLEGLFRLNGGEGPWNGCGRRLRRRYGYGFGSFNEESN